MQVYKYYTLQPGAQIPGSVDSVLGLQTAIDQLKTLLIQASASQGRAPQAFSFDAYEPILITPRRTSRFDEGLKTGSITFYIDPRDDYFPRAVSVPTAIRSETIGLY